MAHPTEPDDRPTFAPAVVDFLRRPLAAHLAMLNPSGSPQLTVMWFWYEDGDLLFTTTTGRAKFRNYRHDPRAAVTILDPDDMWKYVVANGTMSVDERQPQEFYIGLARHYLSPERFATWHQKAQFEGRTVLRLRPTRVRISGFPAE